MSGDLTLELPAAHALHLFRIVQEAITNAIRHAQAEQVWMDLRAEPGAVHIAIRDDGTFRAAEAGHHGVGLAGMRERARELGGTFALETGAPRGTVVRVMLPLAPSPAVRAGPLPTR